MINIAAKPQRIQQASPMQWAAMNIKNHDILVSAAAGSGKTKVLAERIAAQIFDSYIDEKMPNLSISQFVVVTFTDASAKEMKMRIEKQLRHHFRPEHFDDEATQVAGQLYLKQQLIELTQAPISTLHAFCLSIIKEHYYQIEEYYNDQLHSLNPDHQIANDQQLEEARLSAMAKVYHLLEETEGFYQLYRFLSGDRDDSQFNKIIFKLYNQMLSTPDPLKWVEESLDKYYLPEHEQLYYQDVILNMMLPQIEQYLDYVRQKLLNHLEQAKTSTLLDVMNNKEEHLQSQIIEAIDNNIKTIDKCMFELHQCQQQSDLLACSQIFESVQDSLKNFKQWTVKKDMSRKEELLETRQIYNDAIDEFKNSIDQLDKLPSDIQWYCGQNIAASWQQQQTLLPLVKVLKVTLETFHYYFISEKRRMNVIDFQDFEQLALNLLAQHDEQGRLLYDDNGKLLPSDLAYDYQKNIVEIYVDEYQDTNEVQESILNLVRYEQQATFFRVGDLKQSIYKFRQANPKLFIDKAQTYYPLTLPEYYDIQQDVEILKTSQDQLQNSLLIHLSENYRSHYTVLESINYLFNHLMDEDIGELSYDHHAALYYPQVKSDAVPFANTTIEDYAELVLLNVNAEEDEEEVSSVEQQAEYVAQEIKTLVTENPQLQYSDFTILQRSVKSAPIYQRVFAKYNIPFYSPLKEGFMATDEVQTMLSCLRVIDNQNQDIPLVALLRSPLFALSDEQLAYIRILSPKGEFAVQARRVAYQLASIELPEHVDAIIIEQLSQQLRQVFDSIAEWREYGKNNAISELVQYIYQQYHYPQRVLGLMDGKTRQLNLLQFKSFVEEYETNYLGTDLTNFINYVDNILAQKQDRQPPNIMKQNVVNMMTIHGSKGLEFKYVYLVGAEKQFNEADYKSDYLINKQDGIALKYYDNIHNTKAKTIFLQSLIYKERKEMLSEELRLLYVALTRAEYKFTIVAGVKNIKHDDHDHLLLPNTLVQDHKVHPYQRYRAKHYLDFILPVVRMHPTAWAQTPLEQSAIWELNHTTERRANWRVTVAKQQTMNEAQWVINEAVPQITFSQQFDEALQHHTAQQFVETLPDSETSALPSKFGVSRLKKLHQQLTENEQPIYLKYKQLHLEEDDITQEIMLSATERGTIIHRVIELLINAKQVISDQQQLVSFIDDMIMNGKIDQALGVQFQEHKTSIETLYRFTQSAIYQQILNSLAIKTEYPFISRVPLVNLNDNVDVLQVSEQQGVYIGLDYPQTKQTILIQGIIDCLIQIDQQHYVIIDFKSDRIGQRTDEDLIELYKPQLLLYKQAIYQMLAVYQPNIQVDAVLYYLNADKAFEV